MEPLVVARSEWVACPEDPIGEAGHRLFGSSNRLKYLLAFGCAEGLSTTHAIPTTLPAEPITSFADCAIFREFEMELDARHLCRCAEDSEASVLQTDQCTAQSLEVSRGSTGEVLEPAAFGLLVRKILLQFFNGVLGSFGRTCILESTDHTEIHRMLGAVGVPNLHVGKG